MLNLVASHLTGWPAIDPTQRLLKSFYGDDEAAYELPPRDLSFVCGIQHEAGHDGCKKQRGRQHVKDGYYLFSTLPIRLLRKHDFAKKIYQHIWFFAGLKGPGNRLQKRGLVHSPGKNASQPPGPKGFPEIQNSLILMRLAIALWGRSVAG
jgi:hypothetical protein